MKQILVSTITAQNAFNQLSISCGFIFHQLFFLVRLAENSCQEWTQLSKKRFILIPY